VFENQRNIMSTALEFTEDTLFTTLTHLSSEFSAEDFVAAAARYQVVIGSISDQPDGVIQDPAGSAVGTGRNPKGGGLSGVIYRKFQCNPIPYIDPGESVMSSNIDDGRRILHTHSHQLSKAPNLHEAVRLLQQCYSSALYAFYFGRASHGQDTLHFSAVSAAIFAGIYRHPTYNHLDPSVTQLGLVMALADFERVYPNALDELSFNLFYFGDATNPTPLYERAMSVHDALLAGPVSVSTPLDL
jgi:hypothetical protein